MSGAQPEQSCSRTWSSEMSLSLATSGEPEIAIRLNWGKLIWVSGAALLTYLIAGPLLMLIFSSFRSTANKLPFEAQEFTLLNYTEVFTSPTTYKLLLNTLVYGIGSLSLALILTVALAWVLERTDISWRPYLLVGILVPMAMPGVVGAAAWIMLANPNNGLYNVILRQILGVTGMGPLNIYSIPGMILVTGLHMVPPMYLMISGTFSRLDPSFEEASTAIGSGPWGTFWRISLPLLRPGILTALIYYFVLSIEIFEIPGLLGIPKNIFVFSTAIYQAVHSLHGLPNYGTASGYSMLTLAVGILLIYVYARSIRQRTRYSVVTGKGYRPRLIHLSGWKRHWILAGIVAYLFLSIVMPLLILLWASLLPYYQLPSLQALGNISLLNYTRVITAPYMSRAATNTVIVGIFTSTFTMALAALVAWRSIRYISWGNQFPDRLTFVTMAIPSVVIGLAVMLIYLTIPIPIYGTVWILIVAFVTRFIAYATRLMSASFVQIHTELEEASYAAGASWWNTMRQVVLPLVWPSFLRGWLWVCIMSVREVTLAVMLISQTNETVGARLWLNWMEGGNVGSASAMSILLVAVLTILAFIVGRNTIFRGEAPAV
jgi:iron(III) transport system permease protein